MGVERLLKRNDIMYRGERILVSKVSGRCVRYGSAVDNETNGCKKPKIKKYFFLSNLNIIFLHFQIFRNRSTRDRLLTFCPIGYCRSMRNLWLYIIFFIFNNNNIFANETVGWTCVQIVIVEQFYGHTCKKK